MVRLGSQRTGVAVTGFAKAGMRYGDGASSTEQHGGDGKKQRKKAEENGDVGGFKMRPGRTKKPRSSLLASAKPKMATSAPGNQKKVTGGEVSHVVLFTKITELPLV